MKLLSIVCSLYNTVHISPVLAAVSDYVQQNRFHSKYVVFFHTICWSDAKIRIFVDSSTEISAFLTATLRGGECEVLEECGEREARRPHLIQESEQPKRYPAACSDLSVVDCEVAVRNIGNLVECLAFAAHLKKEPAIDEEVSLYGVTDVVQDAQLADEECLPLVSLVHLRTKDVHQAGIAEENLIRFGEGLVILGLGCEQSEDLGLVESIEHLESGFVVRGELPPKFRHIGIEGDMLADNH